MLLVQITAKGTQTFEQPWAHNNVVSIKAAMDIHLWTFTANTEGNPCNSSFSYAICCLSRNCFSPFFSAWGFFRQFSSSQLALSNQHNVIMLTTWHILNFTYIMTSGSQFKERTTSPALTLNGNDGHIIRFHYFTTQKNLFRMKARDNDLSLKKWAFLLLFATTLRIPTGHEKGNHASIIGKHPQMIACLLPPWSNKGSIWHWYSIWKGLCLGIPIPWR